MDLSGKRVSAIKRNLIFDNVVTSSAELVRHCFDGHNGVALGFLFLIEAFDPRIKTDRKVGGRPRPGPIPFTVFGMPLPLRLPLLILTYAPHSDSTKRIADTGKSLDLSALQHDG